MWNEGPGEDFDEHGHYLNMTNDRYSRVACGFHDTGSEIWAVQNLPLSPASAEEPANALEEAAERRAQPLRLLGLTLPGVVFPPRLGRGLLP